MTQEVTIGTFEGEVGANTSVIACNADITGNLRYKVKLSFLTLQR